MLDLEFSYKFDQDQVADVFTRFKGQSGESVKNTFIKPKMKAWTQEVTAKYPVTDVFGDKRQELNEALDKYLKKKFEPYGIIIDTVNFTSISTDDETQAAIQKKVNAQQELELANIEAKTAKVQADKDKEVALIAAEQDKEKAAIEAEQAKITAEGKAEATRIKADAEAEANKKIAESLTPELIEKQKIDKWNGDVPKVQGGNAATIVDAGDLTSGTASVCTDICVITNALLIKTYYPEAKITVDASCCAGSTPEKHKAALDVMESCQINVINRN